MRLAVVKGEFKLTPTLSKTLEREEEGDKKW